MKQLVTATGQVFVAPVAAFGRYVYFTWDSCRRIFYPPVPFHLVTQQIEFIGSRSMSIIVLAAMMVGAVFGLQFGEIFRIFGAESMIGAAASFALSKELAPVVGAFLVTGRAGSAIAAEIATMKVNEQIDAMHVMAVNPVMYLASPRILAAALSMPLLSSVFVMVGVISSYIIGVVIYDVDTGIFFQQIQWITQPIHIVHGMEKAIVFGVLFSSVACYQGFYAAGGAKGVGAATTQSVVVSLVAILTSDFFISYVQMS